jgi:hypothetical protein
MYKGSTAAGGSRVLWTSEFGARILRGLMVLTLEVITKFCDVFRKEF